ncbi:RING finger protein B-like [Impatiens glandulifera]|uniref:RING finger protein B-like n=1 Tax=Impatiens glandulifera TaxID=253017 RepID=UPI001FB0AB1C|nr:RING finger protein B-like [Impatiens glandulifera]
MKWEKLQIQPTVTSGPGKRWGHSCNAINGGKLLYVFGGFGKDNRQTNQVHIFDTVNSTWSEAEMKGIPPLARDSHTCTTIGHNLFVFGGTDGKNPLNDLHILDTSSNTWLLPSVRGEIPQAREGHSASVIGKCLYIFGGSGMSAHTLKAEYYNDLYILNTETFEWKRAETSGISPARRCTNTCSSWKNNIIVIGGEDSNDYYLSDVHILNTDTLVWKKLITLGQPFTPRGGHTTVVLGKNIFVFGGFADESSLHDDIFMLDMDTRVWTKVMGAGSGPSARFSCAGDIINSSKSGVFVLIGGCNINLEALSDMYYLHTGLAFEEGGKPEKLSLRKQLKLKCQEQSMLQPLVVRPETLPHYAESSKDYPNSNADRYNVYPNAYHLLPGSTTFHAKVTKNLPVGYTIETVIDGKLLHGVVFPNNVSTNSNQNCPKRKRVATEVDGAKFNSDNGSNLETITTPMQDSVQKKRQTDDMKGTTTSDGSQPHQVFANIKDSTSASDQILEDMRISGMEGHEVKASTAANPITSTMTEVFANLKDLEDGQDSAMPNLGTEGCEENASTTANLITSTMSQVFPNLKDLGDGQHSEPISGTEIREENALTTSTLIASPTSEVFANLKDLEYCQHNDMPILGIEGSKENASTTVNLITSTESQAQEQMQNLEDLHACTVD